MSTLSSEHVSNERRGGDEAEHFTSDHARQLDDLLVRLLETGEASTLPPSLTQRLLSAGVRSYADRRESDGVAMPKPVDAALVTPTQVATVCLGMLEAVNLEVFELTLWGGALSTKF